MSNGYLAAATADIAAAREIADGFGLDVIDATAVTDPDAVASALTQAPNVGLVLSLAGAQDQAFVALLQSIASRVGRAQLILVEPEARTAFPFLPGAWPMMSLEEARMRAQALAQSRATPPEAATPEPAEPAPGPEPASPPESAPAPAEAQTAEDKQAELAETEQEQVAGAGQPSAPAEETPAPAAAGEPPVIAAPPPATETPPATEPPAAEPPAAPPPAEAPGQMQPAPVPAPAPVPVPAPVPQGPGPATASAPAERAAPAHPKRRQAPGAALSAPSAPADATAFAPKKLRRGTPELVRVVIHQPRDLAAVIKAARKIDPTAAPAPQGMSIGEVALGASVGVSLEVRGAACDGTVQRRTWQGEPIDFAFSVEAEADVRQAVFVARVFIDDAQIGVIAFTRPVSGPAKKPAPTGDRLRLRRHKRVFLSYSSHDREVVSAIATAYEMAGVEHFWDRTSLKSGEEWSPRLRREIDRADLFHLCWSKSAADSEWVEKEAEHALNRRRRAKKPDITVQMLDGPPWAPHPKSLDSINFDDFVRAAIVGYARGEG